MTDLTTADHVEAPPAPTDVYPVSDRRLATTFTAVAAAIALTLLSGAFLIGARGHLNILGAVIVGVTAVTDVFAALAAVVTIGRVIAWSRAKAAR